LSVFKGKIYAKVFATYYQRNHQQMPQGVKFHALKAMKCQVDWGLHVDGLLAHRMSLLAVWCSFLSSWHYPAFFLCHYEAVEVKLECKDEKNA